MIKTSLAVQAIVQLGHGYDIETHSLRAHHVLLVTLEQHAVHQSVQQL